MIKLIIGAKGSGKTKRLVDQLNEQAEIDDHNIVCIERGRRLDRFIKYQVRLIDIDEYPVNSYDQLLTFIAGIYARDYDLTYLVIDSITKVAQSDDIDELSAFLAALEGFSEDKHFDVQLILSHEEETLPDSIRKYSQTQQPTV